MWPWIDLVPTHPMWEVQTGAREWSGSATCRLEGGRGGMYSSVSEGAYVDGGSDGAEPAVSRVGIRQSPATVLATLS
jgi:hypothetical protein